MTRQWILDTIGVLALFGFMGAAYLLAWLLG